MIIDPIDNIKSGSIAAVTYSRNKGGYYARLRTTPVNPNSPRQQETRTILGTVSSGWSSLTVPQREAWDNYGAANPIKNALGKDIYICGQNWYCRINSRLVDASLPELTSPPAGGAPDGLGSLAVTYGSDTQISIAYSPSVLLTGCVVQLLWTLANSMGSTPNKNQSRMVAYSATHPTSPITMTLPGGVVSGKQSTFFAAVMNQEGIMSAFMTHTAARG